MHCCDAHMRDTIVIFSMEIFRKIKSEAAEKLENSSLEARCFMLQWRTDTQLPAAVSTPYNIDFYDKTYCHPIEHDP